MKNKILEELKIISMCVLLMSVWGVLINFKY
jgi:hypothetical protein